jgi:type III restriction enzyme
MVEKYDNKVIIRYDLLQFRNDGFSKDVVIVQSDFDQRERILQALILSQYKQEVAAKYRINLKPVILCKAQRTIAQSQENKADFTTSMRVSRTACRPPPQVEYSACSARLSILR